MKQKIMLIILIILLLLSILPVKGIIVEPGNEWEIGNETYVVEQTMNFSRIIYTDTYIIFNNTGWNISTPSIIDITLRDINGSTTDAMEGDELLEFAVSMVSGSTTMSISGFKSNVIHNISKNGVFDTAFLSNSTGCINIIITGGTYYIYTISRGANNAPVISNPFPSDGATDVSIDGSPVNIYAVDPDGNNMRTDIWTNFTGSWTQVAGWTVFSADNTNYSRRFLIDADDPGWTIEDGQIYWANDGWQSDGMRTFQEGLSSNGNMSVTDDWAMIADGTQYWWSVNCTDGELWTNETYSFTTASNTAPSLSNPSPSDGETEVSVSLISLTINIADVEDTFNWTITTSPDIGSDSANDENDGTKTCTVSGLNYDAIYYWTVTAYDGAIWTNETYHFTVEEDQDGVPPINSAPVISEEYPEDESINVILQPYCHVKVTDADLDDSDINFYNSTDGITYYWQQKNSNVSPGITIYWDYTQASEYDTLYYWKVYANDGTINISRIFSFTTYPNEPVITTYSPADNAVDITRNTSVSITIFDYQGDTMNITWRSNSSGSWVDFGYNNSINNGTFSQRFINSTDYNTQYWWSVNITGSWTNATYGFTTELNVIPVISDPIPRDGKLRVSIYTTNLSVVITDANSLFNYTIETSPDIGNISANNVGSGVKTCVISGLNYSTVYIWYVNATDGDVWVNTSYTFTTKGSTDFDINDFFDNLPEWSMGPYKVYVGDFIWMFLFVGVIAITWGSSRHISSTFIVILLIFAAYGTQRVFVDNSEISLLFSIIAAICTAAIMLGLFLKKKHG